MNLLQVTFCLGMLAAFQVLAEEPTGNAAAGSEGRLEQIRNEVTLHTKRLERFKSEIQKSKQSIERSDLALKQTDERLKKSEEELILLDTKKARVSTELEELERKLGNEQKGSLARIRALYMSREGEASEDLLMESLRGNFLRTSYYFSKIRQSDQQLFRRLSSTIQLREEMKQEVATIYDKQKDLHQQLKKLRDERGEQADQRRNRYKKLLEQQGAAEKAMLALEAQALRLQTVLTSLTESGSTFLVSQVTPKQQVGAYTAPRAVESFKGSGLKKGQVGLPVVGVVLKDYGKRKHEKFSDMVFHKGIEFEAPFEAPVSAVATGKVIYVGKMPVYGNIVILDHGERLYSLYGRIQPRDSLKISNVIEKGEQIGQTLKEPVYFEIRQSGKPTDPQKYFQVQFRVGNKVQG